jgi:hypothetical protein
VLQGIGEKKLGRDEAALAGSQPNHLAQRLAGRQHAAMRVDDALGCAGGAGGIQPERGILSACRVRRGTWHRGARERSAPGQSRSCARARDHEAALASLFGGHVGRAPRRNILDDRQARAAVGTDVPVFRLRKPGIERDRNRASVHRTQPGGGEFGRIAHQQQHAVAGRHANRRRAPEARATSAAGPRS